MPGEFGVFPRPASQPCDDRCGFFSGLGINSPKDVLHLKLILAIATPNAEKTHKEEYEGQEGFANHDSELRALRVLLRKYGAGRGRRWRKIAPFS
jgi:hypothetical protein